MSSYSSSYGVQPSRMSHETVSSLSESQSKSHNYVAKTGGLGGGAMAGPVFTEDDQSVSHSLRRQLLEDGTPSEIVLSPTTKDSAPVGRARSLKKSGILTLSGSSISSPSPTLSLPAGKKSGGALFPAVVSSFQQSLGSTVEPDVNKAFRGHEKEDIGFINRLSGGGGSSSSSNNNNNNNNSNNYNNSLITTNPTPNGDMMRQQSELRLFTTNIMKQTKEGAVGMCIQLYQQLLQQKSLNGTLSGRLDRLETECVVLRREANLYGKKNPELQAAQEENARQRVGIVEQSEKTAILERAGVNIHLQQNIEKQQEHISMLQERVVGIEQMEKQLRQMEREKEGIFVMNKTLKQQIEALKNENAQLNHLNMQIESKHHQCANIITKLETQVQLASADHHSLQADVEQMNLKHQETKRDLRMKQIHNEKIQNMLKLHDYTDNALIEQQKAENNELGQLQSESKSSNIILLRQLEDQKQERNENLGKMELVVAEGKNMMQSHVTDKRNITTLGQEAAKLRVERDSLSSRNDAFLKEVQNQRKECSDQAAALHLLQNKKTQLESDLDLALGSLRGFLEKNATELTKQKRTIRLVMQHEIQSQAVNLVRNNDISRVQYLVAGTDDQVVIPSIVSTLQDDQELTDRLGLTTLVDADVLRTQSEVKPSTICLSLGMANVGREEDIVAAVLTDKAKQALLVQTPSQRSTLLKLRETRLVQLLKQRRRALETLGLHWDQHGKYAMFPELAIQGSTSGTSSGSSLNSNNNLSQSPKLGLKSTANLLEVEEANERARLQTMYGDVGVLFKSSSLVDDVPDIDNGDEKKRGEQIDSAAALQAEMSEIRRLGEQSLAQFCKRWKESSGQASHSQEDLNAASTAASLILNWTKRLHRVSDTSTNGKIAQSVVHYSAAALQQLQGDIGCTLSSGPVEGFFVVSQVQPGRSAAEMGLREGDIVCGIEGKRPKTLIEAHSLLQKTPGQTVSLTIIMNAPEVLQEVEEEVMAEATAKKLGSSSASQMVTRAKARVLIDLLHKQATRTVAAPALAVDLSRSGLERLTLLARGVVFQKDLARYRKAYDSKSKQCKAGIVGNDYEILYSGLTDVLKGFPTDTCLIPSVTRSIESVCVEIAVRATWGYVWTHASLPDAVRPKTSMDTAKLAEISSVDELHSIWRRVDGQLGRCAVNVNADIYLGGSCDPTTWRRDLAMPLCELHGVQYYNPQVDDWTPELVGIEAKAKEDAFQLFFVIDNATRAIGSMLEAAEYIGRGRLVVLVIQNMEPGKEIKIGKDALPAGEIKDLTRARNFLLDMAQRAGVHCYSGPDAVVLAMQDAIAKCNGRVDLAAKTGHDYTIEQLHKLEEHIMKESVISIKTPYLEVEK